jgi:hypothetical protein
VEIHLACIHQLHASSGSPDLIKENGKKNICFENVEAQGK